MLGYNLWGDEWELIGLLVSTWLFKFLWILSGTVYGMFFDWISTLWFMGKIRVWRKIKCRIVWIQITYGMVNAGERLELNSINVNTISIVMH